MEVKIETEKISLHQALRSLKLLDSKILSYVDRLDPIALSVNEKSVDGSDLTVFKKKAIASKQQLESLMTRRQKIKVALSGANQRAKCQVGCLKLTIAEAIAMREHIEYDKQIVRMYKKRLASTKHNRDLHNESVNDNALKLAMAVSGKEREDLTGKELVEITSTYTEKHLRRLVDPLNLENLIHQMEDNIELFNSNIDAALSDANAMNYIEI